MTESVVVRCAADDYNHNDDDVVFVDAESGLDVDYHSTNTTTIIRGDHGSAPLHEELNDSGEQTPGGLHIRESFNSLLKATTSDSNTQEQQPSRSLPYGRGETKDDHPHQEDVEMDDDEDHDDDEDIDCRRSSTANLLLMSNSNTAIDENIFFSVQSFDDDIVRTARDEICTRIESQLHRLEQDEGLDVYRGYLVKERNRRIKKLKKDIVEEKKQLLDSLDDAFVKGKPRGYQRYVLEVAKSKNTIVNLGTGLGKTLIALMCIQDMSSAFYEQEDEGPDDKKSTKKQTLFLVPSVALAIQQSLTLRANLPKFSVATACNASVSSKSARKTLARCNIIVATHGAIWDLMVHWGDMFSMDRFNLVVVDECHYASGNHSYRLLMNKFYHPLPTDKRPRILGLTASPLINLKENQTDEQLVAQLQALEATLDATVVSAAGLGKDDDDQADSLSTTIDERVLYFRRTTQQRRFIPSADNLDLLKSRRRELKQLDQLYDDLGPMILTIYCRILKRELSKNIFECESDQQFEAVLDHLDRIAEFCDQEVKTLPNNGRTDKLLALEELVEELLEEKSGANAIGLVFVQRRITALALNAYFLWRSEQITIGNWPRSKEARQLQSSITTMLQMNMSSVDGGGDDCDMFDDSEDDPFHVLPQYCDVFDDSEDDPFHVLPQKNPIWQHPISLPNERSTSPGIPPELQCSSLMETDISTADDVCPKFEAPMKSVTMKDCHTENSVKPFALVRDPVHIFKSLSISQKKFTQSELMQHQKTWIHRDSNIREVLSDLRRGKTNLIFATSVVEEGVDVQACSFVIAFDGLTSIKGYIQMKGRARKKDAKFFVLQDLDVEKKSQLLLSVAQQMERRVQSLIENRISFSGPASLACPPTVDDSSSQNSAVSKEVAVLNCGCYKVGEASIDLQSAKSILNRYFLAIPLEPYVRSRKETLLDYIPSFDENTLILPVHLPNDMRKVSLPIQYHGLSRREKHKRLSLMACVRLHLLGLLNDRLLPLNQKDMQTRILRAATKVFDRIQPLQLQLDNFYGIRDRDFWMYPIKQTSPALSAYAEKLKGAGHFLGLLTTERIESMKPLVMHHAKFGKVVIAMGAPTYLTCSVRQAAILQQTFVALLNHRWARRSRNTVFELRQHEEYDAVTLPYLIGVLSSNGALDWDLMEELLRDYNRSMEECTRVVAQLSADDILRQARVWYPTYNKGIRYIVYGPSGQSSNSKFPIEKEGIESYQDFYRKVRSVDVASNCPLFFAEREWKLPSGLLLRETDGESPDNGMMEPLSEDAVSKSIMIPGSAFVESPLGNASISLLCLYLPQLLFAVERQQKACAFISHCERHIPTLGRCLRNLDIDKVAQAITSKSCDSICNYEKWEWVGDAVLKLLQADSLMKSPDINPFIRFLHEGDLTLLRGAMGTNERLVDVCERLRLNDYIMTSSISRGKWIPCPLKTTRPIVDEKKAKRKVLADVVESILGLIYLEFGYNLSEQVASELHVILPLREGSEATVELNPSGKENRNIEKLLEVVRMCTGHTVFTRPTLVEEAFTHSSVIDTTVPSYQRLEWMGDAVLCLCVRDWLYKTFGSSFPLGDMVLIEGAIVSNETLGFLSIKYGLQQYINHRDRSLPSRILSYCSSLEDGCGLWGAEPPKPISDVVEAVLGAIHVDSDFAAGQAATMHLMSPVFNLLTNGTHETKESVLQWVMRHPKQALNQMAGDLIEISSCTLHQYQSIFPNTPVLFKDRWITTHGATSNNDELCHVSFSTMLGSLVVAVADESLAVARNKVSSLTTQMIQGRNGLIGRLAKCRSKIERGLSQVALSEGSGKEQTTIISGKESN